MKKEKLFQALSLGQNYILTYLMRTLVIMGLLRPMNQNQLQPMIHNQKVIQRLPQPIVRWQQADFPQRKILAGSKARFRLQCWRR